MAPGFDPRTIRYHDGEMWTGFVCRVGLGGPGKVERMPEVGPNRAPAPGLDMGTLPKLPRIWRPMPDKGKAGWWMSPGFDPRVIRYYDGEDWTEFICRRGLRGPGDIERDPIPAREDLSLHPDPEIRALPQPPRHPPLADQQYANWEGWFRGAGADDSKTARYFHERKPTDFVCDVIHNGAGPVHRRPYQPYKNR